MYVSIYIHSSNKIVLQHKQYNNMIGIYIPSNVMRLSSDKGCIFMLYLTTYEHGILANYPQVSIITRYY